MTDYSDHTEDNQSLPVSARIRARLHQAKQKFHANDNISAFIKPGDLDGLLEEVSSKMKAVLESLVLDIENDHNTQDTARRVAKMYLNEVFRGRYTPAPPVTEFPNAASLKWRSELSSILPQLSRPLLLRKFVTHSKVPGTVSSGSR
jgi:GTP cyclohydrolase IA